MREIHSDLISKTVCELCREAAFFLPDDVYSALAKSIETEKTGLGKSILQKCIENADIAKNKEMPICQDTGFATVFVELGDKVKIIGEENIEEAIQTGVKNGYEQFFLRKSIVFDPLFERKNTGDNSPAFIHFSIVKGENIKITLAPKGGGSENCCALKMLKPSDGEKGVIDFVADAVISVGGNPCPPVIVGVGIGGTAEKCLLAAKKALLRSIGQANPAPTTEYIMLEKKILEKINLNGSGVQGLGGNTTALAVNIETLPTHIACMPVAVAVNCHAARHADVIL
jgi:fumarate hydratase subunit alpha